VSALATTAAELVDAAKRVAHEVIARGSFVGAPMSTGGSCGDGERNGSWLGWEVRVWRDGRWNVVPAGHDRHPDLVLFAILDRWNTASEPALTRALLGNARMRCERVEGGESWTIAGVTGIGHNRGAAREACIDALLAIAITDCENCDHALDVHDENGCTHEHDQSDGINYTAMRCACSVKGATQVDTASTAEMLEIAKGAAEKAGVAPLDAVLAVAAVGQVEEIQDDGNRDLEFAERFGPGEYPDAPFAQPEGR
jgi:hypothetical protein